MRSLRCRWASRQFGRALNPAFTDPATGAHQHGDMTVHKCAVVVRCAALAHLLLHIIQVIVVKVQLLGQLLAGCHPLCRV